MNDTPQPRRAFWRFSLRELLLVMFAIAAFLGWGRAIYQGYRPFTPTPFASKLDLDSEIVLIRQKLGEPPASGVSSSRGGGSGPRSVERELQHSFPLKAANGKAFIEMLRQRFSNQLDACDCQIRGSGRGSFGNMEQFRFHYFRGIVEGSVRVILIPDKDRARLLVYLEERRQ